MAGTFYVVVILKSTGKLTKCKEPLCTFYLSLPIVNVCALFIIHIFGTISAKLWTP